MIDVTYSVPGMSLTEPALSYKFFSGPDRKKNEILVSRDEYLKILERAIGNTDLVEAVVRYWKSYRDGSSEGDDIPDHIIGEHHGLIAKLCDPENSERGSVISAVMADRIESDIIAKFILERSPPWSSDFRIVK
ncbi:MAG: hypothetical protein AAF557_13385 [Pseudomonadota bacterium]